MNLACKTCVHWERDPISDAYLPEDEEGTCTGLQRTKITIDVHQGWDGSYVERVTTDHDFFCANHGERE